MHYTSRCILRQHLIDKLEDRPLKILDIGSLDVNGSYKKEFINPKWEYTGLDIAPGKNVDIVASDPYHYPIKDNAYDIVISGQTLEHVEDMYAWADEIIRITKDLIFIIVPCMWDLHFEIDCWRVYPDGMRWLFIKRTKIVDEININIYQPEKFGWGECYALMRKHKENK